MKVGVVAAEMEGPSTGVGRYLQGLVAGLQAWEHGAEWHFFFHRWIPPNAPDAPGFFCHVSGHRGRRVVWEQARLPGEMAGYDLDVVFCPAYSVPPSLRVPAVVTMHDLSFEIVPGEFGFRERWRRRILARRAVRCATRVLTDTAAMAAMVSERYRVLDDRLAVVPLGVDRGKFSAEPEEADAVVLAGLGIRRPYLLWLGTVLERRLPGEILEAFAALRRGRPDLSLVMAGANRMRSPERLDRWIHDLDLEGHVRLLGWVEETALGGLYRNAEAGLYLSRHEGFGIPPLECLSCGTPVVVSGGLALDTVWPDYPLRCAELTATAIEKTIADALAPGVWDGAMAATADRVLDAMDWESSSRLLVAELEKAVSA